MPPKKDEAAPIASDKPNGLDAAALARQVEELHNQLANVLTRLDTQTGTQSAKPEKIVLTEDNEYVAVARGHASGHGVIEIGQPVPAGIPVGSWMKKRPKKKAIEAEDEDEDGLDDS